VGKKLVRSFISDSFNVMRAVRRSLVDNHTVDFAYGCAANALNNIFEDIVKTKAVKESVRRAMFIAVSIKNDHLLREIYESLAKEDLGKKCAIMLYSSSRWSSINHMLVRLSQVKKASLSIDAAVTSERRRSLYLMSFNGWRKILTSGRMSITQ
jgi:hypothetical protein